MYFVYINPAMYARKVTAFTVHLTINYFSKSSRYVITDCTYENDIHLS